ncbi:hypothetical protein MAPG_11184 [Magnaporthiopsis poae ATCC 64411]|uniref:PD-(D/E)XK nuclease-like domain-containing protein n=1 Tax=Magnaporthiopsis poae (strain ATCC 64411 / 73-15) TaxID=644358 RepID=A0A0C4EEL0_MAGP6|nr:hypothetical protein MAPG_11184 [Magnaporthiopsis poae ATCC 64411]
MPSVAIEEQRAEGSNASSGTTPDPSSTPADLSDHDGPTADCRLLPLRCLAKPVMLQSLSASRHELPADVTGLLRRIEDITLFNEAFVPAAAREMIIKQVSGGARWPDFFFQPSAAASPAPANGRPQGLGAPQTFPGDCVLARAIDTAIAAQPEGWPLSINQTSHEPLARSPIGVSIKTGCLTDGGGFQLGIWTAAWHRRISELLALFPSSTPRPIVTLPLLLCCEHQWELYFAVDRGNEIHLVGPHSVGATQDMMSIYRLLAVLRELCKWVEGPFRSWMMAAFGVSGAPSPPESEDSRNSQ